MRWRFKEEHSISDRKAEAHLIHIKYPNRIPIIVQKAPNASVPTINKEKFLYPDDVTVAQFLSLIRAHVNISSDMALFLIVGNMIPSTCSTLGELYQAQADEDGFLYVVYSSESAFG